LRPESLFNFGSCKFAQLHYSLSQNIGGDKKYNVPLVQKLGGTCPPLNSVPAHGRNEVRWRPVSSEISDFTPCAYAQSDVLHIKYAEKTDD